MLKIADKKLEKLGFEKKGEKKKSGALYCRNNGELIYEIALIHKDSGNYIMQSLDGKIFKPINRGKFISAECKLTEKELWWFLVKMKELGLNKR